MQPTLQDVIDMAQNAGDILRAGFGTELEIHHKGRIDLVTEMDHRSEEYLLGQIHQRFPGHAVRTEESGHLDGDADHVWIIDPLDGTLNYAHGVPIYSISIAYAEKQQTILGVVLNPSHQECFSAQRGKGAYLNGQPIHVSAFNKLVDCILITGFPYSTDVKKNNIENFERFFYEVQAVRRFGSAALDLCYVAAGKADGYWQLESHDWDIAAGGLIVEEAGGIVTTITGAKDYLKPPYGIVASNPKIHPKIIEVLQRP